MKNRLKLDWSLTTVSERTEFITKYLESETFRTMRPTNDELETMSDYILWGADESGRNGRQRGLNLKTRFGTWDNSEEPVDSLEELMEQPTFNEATVRPIGTAPSKYKKKEVFSRDEALRECPESMQEDFRKLFRAIDELELGIAYWELANGKRTNPPREKLVNKFSEAERLAIRDEAEPWKMYYYLKKRHLLVDLRRDQYSLRDAYKAPMVPQTQTFADTPTEAIGPDWEAGITVLPLGMRDASKGSREVFCYEIEPSKYDEAAQKRMVERLWQKRKEAKENQFVFDFRNCDQVYLMINELVGLREQAEGAEMESNLPALVATLEYYIGKAELEPMYEEILQMKLGKMKNSDIAWEVNKKWKKSYTPNYISTIFTQRIVPKICNAAKMQEKLVENICFEEEWKVCSCCGKRLLRDAENFTHKSRSSDGFVGKCKKCEKQDRTGKKEG